MSSPPDLTELARRLASTGPVKTLKTSRRIRILLNGVFVADSTSALFVWEHPNYPYYYLPKAAFDSRYIISEGAIENSNGKVVGQRWRIKVGDKETDHESVLEVKTGELDGYVRVRFDAADSWFEEDTQIFVHPKDPYKRIDIVHSSRRLKVKVGGEVVADTTSSEHLFETGLRPRYYLPLTSVNQSLLRPSKTTSLCPYKGEAEYYSLEVGAKLYKDILWYYTHPVIESTAIQGRVCFWPEKGGIEIEIDGVKIA